jgi:diguanylate cyclase (GGDEF)-like protein
MRRALQSCCKIVTGAAGWLAYYKAGILLDLQRARAITREDMPDRFHERTSAQIRSRFLNSLPHGRHVLESRWNGRHRLIVSALWFHIGFLWVFAVFHGYQLYDAALVGALLPIMAAAWLCSRPRLGRALRSATASIALLCCAAVLVGLWHGTTEAHFDFFVVVTLLMLYGDWLPFALALAFVVGHHATLGLVSPHLVFDHPGSPWLWALVHGGFVLALAWANLAVWRSTDLLQHDVDTGVSSRELVLERARSAVERRRAGARRRTRVSVLVQCDIDRLQLVNDGLGRAAGDRVIREAAVRLDRCTPVGSTVGRLGGDQFVILLDDLASPEAAEVVCARMIDALAEPLDLDDDWRIVPTASFGLVVLDGTQEPELALADAVTAMERAKQSGGGCHRWFERSMHTDRLARHDVERALRRALDERDVIVCYQPIVDLDRDRVVGFEALVRIAGHDGTVIPPDRFIPLAEATGLIHRLGNCVLDTALAQLAEWSRELPHLPVWVSVNCSPVELAADSYPVEVSEALRRNGVSPERVTLEITESALLDHDGQTQQRLGRLHQLGVQLALDDFGSGYSNLGYLSSLPFDKLKIDRAFISGIDGSLNKRAIVQAVIDMADAVGMHAVAEGVETAAEAGLLRRMRCPLGQGYRYGRPLSAEDALALLNACPIADGDRHRDAA